MMWSEGACHRETEVRKLARSTADPELRAHVAECSVCRDTLAVVAWMQGLARLPLDAAPLPNPDYLWWKARILRQWEAERAVVTPIEIGERVQVGIGLVGAVVLLMWLWRELQPQLGSSPGPLLAIALSGVLIATTAVAALALFRQ